MSSERVFAQDFNATRIKALSYLFAEIWPKIKIRSLTRLFPLQDKKGNTVFGKEAQAERWKEHFENILNRPPATK